MPETETASSVHGRAAGPDRIRRIEVVTFAEPAPGASGLPRERLAVVIDTADGVRGEYVGGCAAAAAQTRWIAARLVGRDCHAREALYQEVRRWLPAQDRIGAAVIDIALWDLAGKRTGHSVSDLLGGQRGKRIPACAVAPPARPDDGLSSPEAYVAFAEQCHALGFRAFKSRGWAEGEAGRDAALVRALGQACSGRLTLMHDARCRPETFTDMLAIGRACDDGGFAWLQDPSGAGAAAHAHRRLRELIRTPLLVGGNLHGPEALAAITLADGTDFVRADPDLDGGLTGTVKIAHLAEALGLDVVVGGSGPAQRHAVGSLRNTDYYEIGLLCPRSDQPADGLYTDDYADASGSVGADGCVMVPTGPGLGVAYDPDFIRRHTVEHARFGA